MLSTRRAIEGFAAPEHWDFLLQYRYELKGKCPDNPSIFAWFWLDGTDDGRRLRRFLWWAGNIRVNRSARPRITKGKLYSELYRTVRRMQSSLRDDRAFRFHEQEAQILFDRMCLNYFIPIAKEAQETKRKGYEGAAAEQRRRDGVLEAHQDRIARVVTMRLARAPDMTQRERLDAVIWSTELEDIRPYLQAERLKRVLGRLFPPRRGRRAGRN